ncbi:hypothetical protein MNB_SM-6-1138 [hydrothermal vent metagenome]|uniref:Uncharacterized protein n=1 Tax=hydrothermal vent metagenome TaxID=652676 RepID=A0A1W1BVT7_9ZZZZ
MEENIKIKIAEENISWIRKLFLMLFFENIYNPFLKRL